MGKSIIIKGADFSTNGIRQSVEWYNTFNSLVGNKTTDTSQTLFLIRSEITFLLGKTIRYIRLHSRGNNAIQIGVLKIFSEPGVTPMSYEWKVPQQKYPVVAGVNTILLNQEVVLGTNETIAIHNVGGGGVLTFNNSSVNEGIPYTNVLTNAASNTNKFLFEFGG